MNEQTQKNEVISTAPDESKKSGIEGYNKIGIHRLIGGFYYNMVLFLGGAIFFIVMLTVVVPIILPYPEIEGYSKVVYGLLGFFFGVFDLGSTRSSNEPQLSGQLNDGLLKYIGDYSSGAPLLAMKYIQFFCWFQMVTGIIQISIIAGVALWWFPFTEMAHLTWFILGYSLIQFPGCTSIYESVLKGFQQLDVLAKYQFIKDTIIKYGTMATGVIVGRLVGRMLPQYGELMGATTGYIFALYAAEIITFAMGSVMFSNRMGKKIGFHWYQLFTPTFEKQVVSNLLTFSVKLWVGNLFSQLMTLITNLIIIARIPSYGLWLGIISLGMQFSGFVSMQGQMARNCTAPLAEAYTHGKYDLFRFYVFNLIKYNGFITGYLLSPMVIFFPGMLGLIIGMVPGLSNYEPIVITLPMLILRDALTNSIGSVSGRLFNAANRPMTGVILGIVMSPINLFLTIWCLDVGMTWEALVLAPLISTIIGIIVSFIYFDRKILRLNFSFRDTFWHQFAIPCLMVGISYVIYMGLYSFVVIPTIQIITPFVWAAILFVGALTFFAIFIATPIYTFFGGLDKNSIKILQESAPLAGISKGILNGIIKSAVITNKISPFSTAFPLPFFESAEKEREELNCMNILANKKCAK